MNGCPDIWYLGRIGSKHIPRRVSSGIPFTEGEYQAGYVLMERYHTEGYPPNGFGLVSGRGRSPFKGSQNLEVQITSGSRYRNARCYPVVVVHVVVTKTHECVQQSIQYVQCIETGLQLKLGIQWLLQVVLQEAIYHLGKWPEYARCTCFKN